MIGNGFASQRVSSSGSTGTPEEAVARMCRGPVCFGGSHNQCCAIDGLNECSESKMNYECESKKKVLLIHKLILCKPRVLLPCGNNYHSWFKQNLGTQHVHIHILNCW